MANQISVPWPIEHVPDTDLLSMRVHRNWFKSDGTINPGVFRNRSKIAGARPSPQDGMSTDWQKYATPQETRNRANSPLQDSAVIQMLVEEVRKIPNQSVVHTPRTDNRAHTDVFGEKDTEARVLFLRVSSLAIPFDP